MALEQTVKDLQTQNAQFQEMILNLAKGQEELKALITKKKTKKSAGILNMGRRFRGPVK
jgi:prephenate dehydrogenase